VVKAIASVYVISGACDGVVVFMYMPLIAPLIEEKVKRLLGKFPAHGWVVIVTKAQVDEVVHGAPDPTSPVVLIGEGWVIDRD
jgi:hypothetical protein